MMLNSDFYPDITYDGTHGPTIDDESHRSHTMPNRYTTKDSNIQIVDIKSKVSNPLNKIRIVERPSTAECIKVFTDVNMEDQ